MSRSDRRLVVAVGIDGAEPALVRSLMARGELPCLRTLLERGAWGRVTSPADIGSGAVWPTFMTGSAPLRHGICYDWPWDPDGMRIAHLTTNHLTPFWKTFALEGYAVGVAGRPLRAHRGRAERDRDQRVGQPRLAAGAADGVPGVADRLGEDPRRSPPLRRGPRRRLGAPRRAGPRPARRRLPDRRPGPGHAGRPAPRRDGARPPARGLPRDPQELAPLWHTVDPTHPAHDAAPLGGEGLVEIFREVDRQIGRLAEAAGSEATLLVFSLHGMRAKQGVPTILDPLLRALGLATGRDAGARSWPERARHAFVTGKRLAPAPVKRLYHRLAPRALTRRVEHQGFGLDYDWSRTVAFPMPSDQHGWIRLNLAGREAQGILEPGRYGEVCARLEGLLEGLRTVDGQRVVKDVRRLGGNGTATAARPELSRTSSFTGRMRPRPLPSGSRAPRWRPIPRPPSSRVSTRPTGSSSGGGVPEAPPCPMPWRPRTFTSCSTGP